MIKRILLSALIILLSGGLLGSWFYYAGKLEARGRQEALCRNVKIILLDSLESAIVDKEEMHRFVSSFAEGKLTHSVNLDTIERLLNSRGEVLSAQAYASSPEEISVKLTQRKPVIRFDNGRQRCYCDPEAYIFPVTNAVNVPLVTGKIPLDLGKGLKGEAPEDRKEWILGMIGLARHIEADEFLRKEITQIEIAANGDIVLYTASDGPAIIFGDSGNCRGKFRKLEAWWKNIRPEAEAEGKSYKTINLKYNNQIICR